MRSYGDLNLQQNELQEAVLPIETNFPTFPKAGRIVFKDKILYICADIVNGVPAWIPLTNELDTYIHWQSAVSTIWTIQHQLNTGTPSVQIYDANSRMIIPNEVQIISNNEVQVTFNQAVAGRAIVLAGNNDGATREQGVFEYTQTVLSNVWTINHGFGYYPIVRIFVGSKEIQPQSIDHVSLFTTIVTFTSSTLGIARLI